MSEDKKQQEQIQRDNLREELDKCINREQHRGDQASYQPEKNELDDNNPPTEDSE